jgi:hypothetical protein
MLYLTMILALVSSLNHVAQIFSTVNGGSLFMGYVTGISIDLGLIVMSASLNHRKGEGKRAKVIWGGIFIFSAISCYANWIYGISCVQPIAGDTGDMGRYLISLRPIILSGILPLLCIYMTEILSLDYQNKVAKESARIKRAETKAKKTSKGKNWTAVEKVVV